jgi:dipeptidyl aminopeptidase/acylaminoacyl peptidase
MPNRRLDARSTRRSTGAQRYRHLSWPRCSATATLITSALVAPSVAAQSGYREPPPVIAAILDAAPTPSVSLSPDRTRMALLQRAGYPSIAEVAAPELRLAGLRFDPVTNGPSRGSGVRGISVQPVRGGTARALDIPLPTGDAGRGAPIANVSWSPSGERIFFTIADGERIQPWVADVATGAVRRLADVRLNAVLGAPCSWLGAEPALICRLVPSGRGAAPAAPTTPDGPILQESEGGRADRVATYQDLLKSPHDEALFTYFATSQVARIDLTGAGQLWERNSEDRYADPGDFITTRDARGQTVLFTSPDRKFAFLTGAGASPKAIGRSSTASSWPPASPCVSSRVPPRTTSSPSACSMPRGTVALTRRESKTEAQLLRARSRRAASRPARSRPSPIRRHSSPV